jgi:SAM-dependent methyltransferase
MTNPETALYDKPAWYDILYTPGTADEVWLLEKLNFSYGTGGRHWLEPACGSGRYIRLLARKGYNVTGYDSHKLMLAYARRHLAKTSARIAEGEMTRFCRPGAYDMAFCLVNTFRHLLTERAALHHLRLTALSLKAGGLYVLGLDLVDYGSVEDDEETWSAGRGSCRIDQMVLTLAPERKKRRETVINTLTVKRGRKKDYLQSSYDLRSYDVGQFKKMIGRSPFSLAAAHGPDGKACRLDQRTRDAYFVLKKRPSTPSSRPARPCRT